MFVYFQGKSGAVYSYRQHKENEKGDVCDFKRFDNKITMILNVL